MLKVLLTLGRQVPASRQQRGRLWAADNTALGICVNYQGKHAVLNHCRLHFRDPRFLNGEEWAFSTFLIPLDSWCFDFLFGTI